MDFAKMSIVDILLKVLYSIQLPKSADALSDDDVDEAMAVIRERMHYGK